VVVNFGEVRTLELVEGADLGSWGLDVVPVLVCEIRGSCRGCAGVGKGWSRKELLKSRSTSRGSLTKPLDCGLASGLYRS
jgi:hypothetical protein